MADRIIKDIRYYESNVENVDGNSMPHNLGQIFQPTTDTNYIGQRIARKLHEFEFSYGEFDHIYINLTTYFKDDYFKISNRNIDKRIKYIDYGLSPKKYNSFNDTGKNHYLQFLTFKILKDISSTDSLNIKRVEQTEFLINKFSSEIEINYKTKETRNYKVDISYQINPTGFSTRAIIKYLDKKNNAKYQTFLPLRFYEDIYLLIDVITLKDEVLTLNPKKSFHADLSNKRYNTPIKFKITELDKI